MKIIKRAYKFRFYPQNDLKVILAKTFGCSRFVFNKALELSEKNYTTKFTDKDKQILNPEYKPLSNTDRINYIVQLKQSNPWLKEVTSIALQQSIRHLNTAYDRFFKGKSGKPQFKKKLNRNSFTITGKDSLHFDKDFTKNKQFCLPKYNKPLNIKFSREFNHLAVSSVTISQEPSGKYFISFLVEEELKQTIAKNHKVSIDLGIKTHAKVYDGNQFYDFNLPDLIKSIDKKIVKAQRILSRSIHSIAWSRFTSMLEYKSNWKDRELSKANRFYPSSKLCSCCGHINHGLKLKDRTWVCINCNAQHDRDENACVNLYNYDESSYKCSKTVGATVCGGNVRPESLKKITSKKTKAVSYEAGILAI